MFAPVSFLSSLAVYGLLVRPQTEMLPAIFQGCISNHLLLYLCYLCLFVTLFASYQFVWRQDRAAIRHSHTTSSS